MKSASAGRSLFFPRLRPTIGLGLALITANYANITRGQTSPGVNFSVQLLNPQVLQLGWDASLTNYALEASSSLGTNAFWQGLNPTLSTQNGRNVVIVPIDAQVRYFRLRATPVNSLFTIAEFTPAIGSVDVGVTERPKLTFSRAVDPQTLTTNSFYASVSGQRLNGNIVPSNDGRFAWLFLQNPMPGGSRVQVTVDGSAIKSAGDGALLDAAGLGNPGSIQQFSFTTVSLAPLPNTSLSGIVVDPGPDLIPRTADDLSPGPDGVLGTADDVFLLPIQGVQVHLLGRESQVITTGVDGRFYFDAVPAGDVKVVIDGTTVTNPPVATYFPEMVIDAHMNIGATNWTMTNGPEIYLPRLSTSILQSVSNGSGSQIQATANGAPNLSAFQRSQLTLNIAPGSLIGPDGKPMSTGQIGISTVPPEVVRDMLPPGALQHTFDITIQAPGVATFSTPAPMTFPNVFNAAPGTKLNFLSFDHTTGRLVIEGTATVSADGATVVTDPGTGVTHPGWHGLTPPGSPSDPPCSPLQARTQKVTPEVKLYGLQDYLFYSDGGDARVSLENSSFTSDPCQTALLGVEVTVDGPADEFLEGIPPQIVSFLEAGAVLTIDFHLKDLLPDIKTVEIDRLYGVKIRFRVYSDQSFTTPFLDKSMYLYRFLDAADSEHGDGTVSMADTGTFVERQRPIEYHVGSSAMPTYKLDSNPNWVSLALPAAIGFMPSKAGANLATTLHVITPEGNDAGTLTLTGTGKDQTWYVDSAGFDQSLVDAAASLSTPQAVIPFIDTPEKRQALIEQAAMRTDFLLQEAFTSIRRVTANSPDAIRIDKFTSIFSQQPGLDFIGRADFIDVQSQTLQALLAGRANYSQAEQNYRLSKTLNQNPGADILMANVNYFRSTFLTRALTDTNQIINDFGATMAHEIGHTIGLYHTATQGKAVSGNAANDEMDSSGTYPYGLLQFDVTAPAGQVALGDPWASKTAQKALDYYGQYFALGGNFKPSLNGSDDPNVGAPTPFNGPVAWIHQNETNFVGSVWDMGPVLVDGPGGVSTVQAFTLENLGDAPLIITSLTFLNAAPGFGLSAASPGATIAPGTNITFTMAFDPTNTGPASAHLRLVSNALAGNYDVEVNAFGVSGGADIRLLVPNNNAGGAYVGAAGVSLPNFLTITNQGSQSLQITGVQFAGGQNPNEFGVTGLPAGLSMNSPLIIAAGGSYSLGLTFAPGQIGLRNGILEITSNDPQTPRLHEMVVGTGLAASTALHYGNDYVAYETPDILNAPVLRTKSDGDGNWSFFLPPQARYHWTIFDPVSGLVAHGYGITAASGDTTHISTPAFVASTSPDSDGDGLPDDIEFALGTSPNKVDTNGDGLSDFSDLILGLDPLAGRRFPTGIVGQLPLNAPAQQVVVAAPANASQQLTAYVTYDNSSTDALAIVDVSQFNRPLLLGQASLPSKAYGLAVDPDLKIAAAAVGLGLYLVDVSNPTQPVTTGPVPGTLGANRVVIYNGAAFIANGFQLSVVNLVLGTVVQSFPLGDAAGSDLAVEGHYLYCLDSNSTLRVLDLSGGGLVQVGSVSLPSFGQRLAVGNGVAYVTSYLSSGGYSTIDVSDPQNPRLITGPTQSSTTLVPSTALALNGSGLAVLAGTGPQPVLDVVSTAQPTNTYSFITRYNLNAPPQAVAMAAGIAYIADDSAGLVIANIVPFDTLGQAPVVTVDASAADVDPSTAGIQVLEGSDFPVAAHVSDDVQVRNVDLMVNGQVVQTSVSFPFELFGTAPLIATAGTTITIQVRATDTGGNSTLSSPITLQLLKDTMPPTLVSIDPPDGGKRDPGLTHVNITFSKPLSPSSAALSNFVLTAAGQSIPITAVTMDRRTPTLQLSFGPLPAGDYQIMIHASGLSDRAGNVLAGPDIISHFSLPSVPIINFLGASGLGLWMQPTNWDLGRVPLPGDTVVIQSSRFASTNPDVAIFPTSPTQQYETVQVRDVITDVNFGFDAIQFQATGSIQFQKVFVMGDGRLFQTVLEPGPNASLLIDGNFLGIPYLTSVWDDVTLNGNLAFSNLDPTAEALTLTNKLTINGTLSGGALWFVGPVTIDGVGQLLNMAVITLTNDSNGDQIAWPASTLTLSSNVVVQGSFQANLSTNTSILNLGFLSATQPVTPFGVLGDPLGSGYLTNSGTIRIGPANTVQVAPDFDQTATGHLLIEIGGTKPGVSYGQLQISGTATLDGELKVTLVGGEQPLVGDSFDLVLYKSVSGQFNSLSLPSLPTGLA